MKSYFFSIMLGKAALRSMIKEDTVWAVGACLFVFFYMAFHMQSFFLAVFAVSIIIFSFAVTQTIYVWGMGINYFQVLHFMCVFLVLGIAADDVFVFHDAWIQSKTKFSKE